MGSFSGSGLAEPSQTVVGIPATTSNLVRVLPLGSSRCGSDLAEPSQTVVGIPATTSNLVRVLLRNRLRRRRRRVPFELESRGQFGRRGAALDQERARCPPPTWPLTSTIGPVTDPLSTDPWLRLSRHPRSTSVSNLVAVIRWLRSSATVIPSSPVDERE